MKLQACSKQLDGYIPPLHPSPAIVWSAEWLNLMIRCVFVILIICLRNWMSLVLLNYEKHWITIIFSPFAWKYLMIVLLHKCLKELLTFIYKNNVTYPAVYCDILAFFTCSSVKSHILKNAVREPVAPDWSKNTSRNVKFNCMSGFIWVFGVRVRLWFNYIVIGHLAFTEKNKSSVDSQKSC